MSNTVFTVIEVATYLNVCENTIRRRVRKKELPFYRVGGRIMFRKDAIDKWLEEQEAKNAAGW